MRYGVSPIQLPSGGLARFIPLENRVAHALHGAARGLVRLLPAGVENTPNFFRMRLKFLAACLNRLDPVDEVIRHQRLAIDAADRRRAAFVVARPAIVLAGENSLWYANTGQTSGRPGSVRRWRCGSVIMLRTLVRISSGGSLSQIALP